MRYYIDNYRPVLDQDKNLSQIQTSEYVYVPQDKQQINLSSGLFGYKITIIIKKYIRH